MENQDLGYEFENAAEEEESAPTIKKDILNQAYLSASDWTIETILSQLHRKNIDLNPRFQRRDAWSLPMKSKFIESLILGFPIPQIVLAEKKSERGKYLVLDGKQRLLSLYQFNGRAEGANNAFALKSLKLCPHLNGKKFEDFESDANLQEDFNSFYNQTIRTVVLRNWPNNAYLHSVFHRLNTSGVALSPQELRQALFPGEFINFIDDTASNSLPLRKILNITGPDNRMGDIELLLRYMAFSFYLDKYSGSFSDFLDKTCENLNKRWQDESELIVEKAREFESAINAAEQIFGERHVGKKWNGEKFDNRLNRVVLDMIVYYFSKPEIRAAALDRSAQVLDAFKNLCLNDTDFKQALSLTTKSMSATYDRLGIWGNSLASVLEVPIAIPALNNNVEI